MNTETRRLLGYQLNDRQLALSTALAEAASLAERLLEAQQRVVKLERTVADLLDDLDVSADSSV